METYEQIYERMKQVYEAEIGDKADESSDIAIRLRTLAGEIFSAQTTLDFIKRQMFPSTAQGEYLDNLAVQRGLERKPAASAAGELSFSVDSYADHDILIPAGTTAATGGEAPVRVRTTKDAVLPYGYSSVTVAAEAELAGYSGNISTGTATVGVNLPAEISGVTNLSYFFGGSDIESDTSLRERILSSYTLRPNGMNAAYYEQLALSVDGVKKVGVIGQHRGAGTVDVFISDGTSSASSSLIESVSEVLEKNRELNVDVKVQSGYPYEYDLEITVTPKSGYEPAEVKSILTASFEEYLRSIPMGGKLYLSSLGKYLLETDCILTYEFSPMMEPQSIPGSQFFVAGQTEIEVI